MYKKNKTVLIKEDSFISDDYVYDLLKFNKNYLPQKRKDELLEEYRLGEKSNELGLDNKEFDTFEKYLNILYDIYMDEKGVYIWKSDEDWSVVDIDRDDEVLLTALIYNEVYIDGRLLDDVNDDILAENFDGDDVQYAVVYMERE